MRELAAQPTASSASSSPATRSAATWRCKLAGEYGDATRRRSCAASARCRRCMELAACVRALERRSEHRLPVELRARPEARMRRKARAIPGRFDRRRLARSGRVRAVRRGLHRAALRVRRAPTDYYHRASALRVDRPHPRPALDHHRRGRSVRAAAPFRDPRWPRTRTSAWSSRGRRPLRVRRRASRDDDGYWAETQIVRFAWRRATEGPEVTVFTRSHGDHGGRTEKTSGQAVVAAAGEHGMRGAARRRAQGGEWGADLRPSSHSNAGATRRCDPRLLQRSAVFRNRRHNA